MAFRTGIENLIKGHSGWLSGRRIALASHAAAVDHRGRHSADLLCRSGANLTALFGPEHGFVGTAGAGAAVKTTRSRKYGIPVYSLYGATRQPSQQMFKDVDTVVIDFHNIPARCYTYLATMINIMRACAEHDIEVIVADRPVPMPNTVDGPPLCKGFSSFVAPAPLPMAYGMTLGEVARWAEQYLELSPTLKISRMTGYRREEYPQDPWPKWLPPSPAITSWDAALSYLSTVSCEALPVLDAMRGSSISFQAVTTPWLDTVKVTHALNALRLQGVCFHPVEENATVLIEVTSPRVFKPVTTGIAILAAIRQVHGVRKLWSCADARPDFFDKLYGGPATRIALKKGATAKQISSRWRHSREKFMTQRRNVLLYRRGKSA